MYSRNNNVTYVTDLPTYLATSYIHTYIYNILTLLFSIYGFFTVTKICDQPTNMETHDSMHMQQICTGGCLQSILLAQHFVKQLCCIPRVYIYSIRNCSAVQYSAVQCSIVQCSIVLAVRRM